MTIQEKGKTENAKQMPTMSKGKTGFVKQIPFRERE